MWFGRAMWTFRQNIYLFIYLFNSLWSRHPTTSSTKLKSDDKDEDDDDDKTHAKLNEKRPQNRVICSSNLYDLTNTNLHYVSHIFVLCRWRFWLLWLQCYCRQCCMFIAFINIAYFGVRLSFYWEYIAILVLLLYVFLWLFCWPLFGNSINSFASRKFFHIAKPVEFSSGLFLFLGFIRISPLNGLIRWYYGVFGWYTVKCHAWSFLSSRDRRRQRRMLICPAAELSFQQHQHRNRVQLQIANGLASATAHIAMHLCSKINNTIHSNSLSVLKHLSVEHERVNLNRYNINVYIQLEFGSFYFFFAFVLVSI